MHCFSSEKSKIRKIPLFKTWEIIRIQITQIRYTTNNCQNRIITLPQLKKKRFHLGTYNVTGPKNQYFLCSLIQFSWGSYQADVITPDLWLADAQAPVPKHRLSHPLGLPNSHLQCSRYYGTLWWSTVFSILGLLMKKTEMGLETHLPKLKIKNRNEIIKGDYLPRCSSLRFLFVVTEMNL